MNQNKIIQIHVDGLRAVNLTPDIKLVHHNKSEFRIHFTFSDDWADKHIKTVLFVPDTCFGGGGFIPVIMDVGEYECEVPMIEVGYRLLVGVSAGELKTTRAAVIECDSSIRSHAGEQMPEPETDVYDQIMAVVNRIYEVAQSVRDDADEGKFNGEITPEQLTEIAEKAAELVDVDINSEELDRALEGKENSGVAAQLLSGHNVAEDAHNDIRQLIFDLFRRLNTLADSEDVDLDQLTELIAYMKSNRDLIATVTTSKVSVSDIINDLVTNVSNKPLSAAQGVVLKSLIDAITVPTKLSELEGDDTHRTVTDAQMAQWSVTPKDGTSVTVSSVQESTESGGENVVSFSDGKQLTVLNGRDGDKGDPFTYEDFTPEQLAALAQGAPEFVDSVEDMTDTSKIYVNTVDGEIYVYGTKTTLVAPTNLFDKNQLTLNKRYNSSGGLSDSNGTIITHQIPCAVGDVFRIKQANFANGASGAAGSTQKVVVGDASGVKTFYSGVFTNYWNYTKEDDTFIFTIGDYKTQTSLSNVSWISFSTNISTTAVTIDDIPDIIITKNESVESSVQTVTGFHSTGMAYAPADYEPRIIDLEESEADHENRISALESGAVETVPAFWQTAIDALEPTMELRQASGHDAFQFIFFSDMHGAGTSSATASAAGHGTNNKANIGVVCQRVCEQYDIPFVALAGDVMSQSSHTEELSVHTEYRNIRKILDRIDAEKFLCTIGNHDGAWGAAVDGVYYLKDIGNRELYNKIFRSQATDVKRVFGEAGTYFYVDSHAQKIRFVMLNFHTDGDGSNDSNGYAVYNSMKNPVLGTKQLRWFENDVLDVPEGWGIVLMGHIPVSTAKDGSLLSGIISAYNNKTAYTGASVNVSGTYWGNGMTSEYNTSTTENKDFSTAQGEIIAYFHGHIHKDTIDSTSLVCPSISITTAGGDVRDTYTIERVPNTATETAMDIVTIDRNERIIHMTRLGAGYDRQVAY